MSDDKFDVIIVGGGLAGGTAEYLCAEAGLETLVIERGNFSGAKNMTDGRLYAHSLEKLFPGFAEEAPVERCITREKISFLMEDSAFTMDYSAPEDQDPAARSYTVLRSKLDHWLMENLRMFNEYPELVTGVMKDLFTVNGPNKAARKKILPRVRKIGLLNLAKDGFKGIGAI